MNVSNSGAAAGGCLNTGKKKKKSCRLRFSFFFFGGCSTGIYLPYISPFNHNFVFSFLFRLLFGGQQQGFC